MQELLRLFCMQSLTKVKMRWFLDLDILLSAEIQFNQFCLLHQNWSNLEIAN